MVILLHGPDTYRSRQRLKQLVVAFKQKYDPTGVNVSTIDGAKFDFAVFRAAAGAAGFLAKKRLLLVDGLLGQTKGMETQREVTAYLEGEEWSDENVLIFSEGDLGMGYDRKKRKAVSRGGSPSGRTSPSGGPLLAWLLEHAKLEEFPLLAGEPLNRWIRDEIKRQGGTIEPPAVLELSSLVGSDLWQMAGEIGKLVAHARGKPISTADVRELVRGRFDENIFHLTDALSQKDERQALILLSEQFAAGSHALYLLTMLTRQFRILLQVKEVLAAESHPATVASRLKLHPFVAQKAIREARRFDRTELVTIFSKLADLDLNLKTSQGDPQALLTLFIHRVCRGEPVGTFQ